MRVCLYYSVWLTVVLFGLSLSAVGIGRAAPLPYEVAALGMSDVESCDGVCFAGVTAGKTNWLEARKNLASQVRDDSYTQEVVISVDLLPHHLDETLLYFFRSVDKVSVGRMNAVFRVEESALTAGWLVARYGIPCGVSLYLQDASNYRMTQPRMTLRYPQLVANLTLPHSHLEINSPLISIHVYDPAFVNTDKRLEPCRDNITDGVRNRYWHGFGSVARYISTPRN
ncbi:MAG: hypothetical protein OHK0023_28760 [Anaerolineae bacterium]